MSSLSTRSWEAGWGKGGALLLELCPNKAESSVIRPKDIWLRLPLRLNSDPSTYWWLIWES